MIIKVLAVQRNQRYEGEWLSEVLECIREEHFDDFSDWFLEKYEETIKRSD